MKTNLLFFVVGLFISSSLFSQTIIFQDNFDSYSDGMGIASQSTSWKTWTLSTGFEDAKISSEQAGNGDKSLHIVNNNDILYDFGSKISGAYQVEFKMFIKSGNGAYLNLEHGNRTKFAFQMFFRENHEIWFDNGTDSLLLTNYNPDEWFSFKFSIDLNSDELTIYKNDNSIGQFVFSRAMNTTPLRALGFIDFYGANNMSSENLMNSDFFIDGFKYVEITPADPLTGCDFLNYYASAAQANFGNYSDLGTSGSLISTSGNFDDANSGPVEIGFTFKFNCLEFTQFILNTNGFIKLGDTAPSSAALFFSSGNTKDGGIFSSTSPLDVNLVSPFNHDLDAGSDTPEYRVYTEGSSPYRICTIQFKNLKDKTSLPLQQLNNIEFQIRLYETSNIIEFIYGTWTPSFNASATKTSACGLKGSSFLDKDLLTVSKASNVPWFSASFINANYSGNAFNFGNQPDRPLPDFGATFRFVPAYTEDLKIDEIYALGTASVLVSNPQTISASISNVGMSVITNTDVQLEVTGANSFMNSVNIPEIYPRSNAVVSFDIFSPFNLGLNDIKLTLPDDDNLLNNEKYITQNLTENQIRYADNRDPDINWGYNTNNGGILLTKYAINGLSRVYSVDVFLTYLSSVGYPLYAVIMNEEGTITERSDDYIVESGDLNLWHPFVINNAPFILDESFYAGLAIPPSIVTNYPLGVQSENPSRGNAYFWSPIGGGTINTSSVRFMIGVSLIDVTGVQGSVDSNSSVRLFPNPASEIITVSGITGTATAGVYSCNGDLLMSFQLDKGENDLNIAHLMNGVYILKFQDRDMIVIKKLIKQ